MGCSTWPIAEYASWWLTIVAITSTLQVRSLALEKLWKITRPWRVHKERRNKLWELYAPFILTGVREAVNIPKNSCRIWLTNINGRNIENSYSVQITSHRNLRLSSTTQLPDFRNVELTDQSVGIFYNTKLPSPGRWIEQTTGMQRNWSLFPLQTKRSLCFWRQQFSSRYLWQVLVVVNFFT